MEEEKKGSLLKVGLIETGFIIILLVIIFSILSYLNIIPLKKLLTFKIFPSAEKPKTTTAKATPVDFQCPVSMLYCRNSTATKYNKQPAITFNVPSGTSIMAVGKLTSYNVQTFKSDFSSFKAVYASFIQNEKCYTVTYVIPSSSTLKKLDEFPVQKGTEIATLTNEPITLDKKTNFNLLTQLQVREIDPKTEKEADYIKCTVLNKKSSEFGKYINLTDSSMFH